MRTRDFLFGLGMALLCSQVVNAQENRQRHQRMSKEEMQEINIHLKKLEKIKIKYSF